jgi:pectinesterase inhibitor-like protein
MAPPRTSTATSLLVFVLTATAAASTFPTSAAASPPPPKVPPPAKAPPPPPPPCAAPPSVAAFLLARCATTLYRATCYDTLIPYGCAFGTNPVRLARTATDVGAAQLRTLSALAKDAVARGQPQQGVAYYALRDCASTVSSAARLSKQSAAELARLDAAGGNATVTQVRWAISNAQTWLSAAMSNEVTCAEGLAPWGGASPAAKALVDGAVDAMQSTSVALTMVNGMPR